MKESSSGEDWFLSIVSGRRKGAAASIARGVFSIAEPGYTAVVHARNFLYTRRILKAAHARRPVISVGNITTGGTGKTPIVAWLVEQLRDAGRVPAVLLRGYKSASGSSDEELLLRNLISPSPVKAQPDRFAASEQVLAEHPQVDAFVLDDGLQHRQLARYCSIVLVDATAPFGYDHVLPRGLLREPMRAFRRANIILITRADLCDSSTVHEIEQRIRAEQPDVPIFRCNFKQDRVIDSAGMQQPIEALHERRIFAFCGIGNPQAFFRQVEKSGHLIGSRRFPDHHRYAATEITAVLAQARELNAEFVLMTEKDWVKIAPMADRLPSRPAMMRVGLSVQIEDADRIKIMKLVMDAIHQGDELLGWKR